MRTGFGWVANAWFIPFAYERMGGRYLNCKSKIPNKACHTSALLWWGWLIQRRYIECPLSNSFYMHVESSTKDHVLKCQSYHAEILVRQWLKPLCVCSVIGWNAFWAKVRRVCFAEGKVHRADFSEDIDYLPPLQDMLAVHVTTDSLFQTS